MKSSWTIVTTHELSVRVTHETHVIIQQVLIRFLADLTFTVDCMRFQNSFRYELPKRQSMGLNVFLPCSIWFAQFDEILRRQPEVLCSYASPTTPWDKDNTECKSLVPLQSSSAFTLIVNMWEKKQYGTLPTNTLIAPLVEVSSKKVQWNIPSARYLRFCRNVGRVTYFQ